MSFPEYRLDTDYASSRLTGAIIVTKKNEPIRVKKVFFKAKGLVVSAQNLITGEHKDIPMSDVLTGSPKLGLVNTSKTSLFISRFPIRFYKQGLCSSNLTARNVFNGNLQGVNPQSPSFGKMLANIYPTVMVCADTVMNEENVSVMAFCREFGFRRKYNKLYLFYKFRTVGKAKLNFDSGVINFDLNKDDFFLKEKLEKYYVG